MLIAAPVEEGAARPMSNDLSPVFLSAFGLRREPPRPAADRELGYEDRYDSETMFFDVFFSEDGRQIIAPCPPALNCDSSVASASWTLGHGPTAIPLDMRPDHRKRVYRATLPETESAPSITLAVAGRTQMIPVQPSGCSQFADRKVLYTLSKDNPLNWIRDWATFYVRIHGVDAVLFYDNGSTAYNLEDVRNALAQVEGLKTFAVQSWTFPYGSGEGPNGEWDSNYCQNGAFAHARWRYCATARAFINADIDEMVVCDDGRSVLDHLEESNLPCLTYAGRWVTALRARLGSDRPFTSHKNNAGLSHADCLYYRSSPPYPNKWVVAPQMCDQDSLWGTHEVKGLEAAVLASDQTAPMVDDIMFRHCRQISTNFKYDRSRLPTYDSHRYEYDVAFAHALAKAFPERKIFGNGGGSVMRLKDRLSQYWSW